MTLTELSKETSITMKTLSAFQNQKVESVQFNTLEKITYALDIGINDLLSIENSKIILEVELKEKQRFLISKFIFSRISDNSNDCIF